MPSEEKMEMLTKMFKSVDKLWRKYQDSWTCESCKIRDLVIISLVFLLLVL